MKIRFKHYMHDEEFRVQDALREAGFEHLYDEEMYEKVGRPFYEITLDCVLDTATGEVTVESVKL